MVLDTTTKNLLGLTTGLQATALVGENLSYFNKKKKKPEELSKIAADPAAPFPIVQDPPPIGNRPIKWRVGGWIAEDNPKPPTPTKIPTSAPAETIQTAAKSKD